jgi:hypothetical protein
MAMSKTDGAVAAARKSVDENGIRRASVSNISSTTMAVLQQSET